MAFGNLASRRAGGSCYGYVDAGPRSYEKATPYYPHLTVTASQGPYRLQLAVMLTNQPLPCDDTAKVHLGWPT